MHVEEGPVVKLDRWHLQVWPNPQAHELEGVDDVPLHVINNYFSIGADAHTALEFHLGRGESVKSRGTSMGAERCKFQLHSTFQ